MTGSLNIHPATADDAARFSGLFRPQDKYVCSNTIGMPADDVANVFVNISPVAFAAYDGDVPLALFGSVASADNPEIGTPWLLRTPEAERKPLTMARVGKRYADTLAAPFTSLMDFPFEHDDVTRRWLSWLGLSEIGNWRGRVIMERKGGRHGTCRSSCYRRPC